MSETKMAKFWHWISPSPTISPTSNHKAVEVQTKPNILCELTSKPLKITENCITQLSTAKHFIPIQRLDSTGQDPGYSYPPYGSKTVKDKIMGNAFHSSLQGHTFQAANSSLRINCMSRLFKNLSDLSEASRFTSMPSKLNTSDQMDSYSVTKCSLHSVLQAEDQAPKPVKCDFNWSMDSGNQHLLDLMQQASQSQPPTPLCAFNVKVVKEELQVMSSECYQEVQAHEEKSDNRTMSDQCNNSQPYSEQYYCGFSDESDFGSESEYSHSESSDEYSDDEADFSCADLVDSNNDTDSEDTCPWDKLTLSRNPWTCSKVKKPKRSRYDLSRNNTTPASKNRKASEDVCLETHEESVFCDDLDSEDDEVLSTVKRPTCSNSYISYIIGSDSEDEDDLHQQESSSICYQSDESSATPDSSCKLWDYFMKLQEPFFSLTCSQTVNTSSSSCPSTETIEKPPLKQPVFEDVDLPPRPTKVRFCDKVIVHPMVVWSFAYRQARMGNWSQLTVDKKRFQARIETVNSKIGWCFATEHRNNAWLSRHGKN